MVLFQPASGPTFVWEFGWYGGIENLFDVLYWVPAILSAIFALFLLAAYLNDRKPAHFYWGISFALLYINTHLLIFGGDYSSILDPVPSVMAALTIGFFAVGIVKNVKPDGTLGKYLTYYVLIMSLAIGFVKAPYFGIPEAIYPYVVMAVVMAVHVPSAVLIVWFPLTTRTENGNSALVLPLGAILMSLIGILLIVVIPQINEINAAYALFEEYEEMFDDGLITQIQLDAYEVIRDAIIAESSAILEPIFYAFPFVYLGATVCFAWGTFVPKRWTFNIPGIELE